MLATFLKGLVTGAARGAARNINKENERMRESFDTASKMFLDQVTKERQLRSLKRTEIMGKMNRIEALDEFNILTPAELYILAGNDANFTKVINDLDKQLVNIEDVKTNIAFSGKNSPMYANKEQAIEANLDPFLAVRPVPTRTTTAYGIESGIQQQMAADLEAAVPTGSMEARDAQGNILPRVAGAYKPAMDPALRITGAAQLTTSLRGQSLQKFNLSAKKLINVKGTPIYYIKELDRGTFGQPTGTSSYFKVNPQGKRTPIVIGTDPYIDYLEAEASKSTIKDYIQSVGNKTMLSQAEQLAIKNVYSPIFQEYGFSEAVGQQQRISPNDYLKYLDYYEQRKRLEGLQAVAREISNNYTTWKSANQNATTAAKEAFFRDQRKEYASLLSTYSYTGPIAIKPFFENINKIDAALPKTFKDFLR